MRLDNHRVTPQTIDSYLTWLTQKRNQRCHESDDGREITYPLNHAWSYQSERKKFVKAKDVDRYFWDKYDKFTTVMITRCADESNKGLLEQTECLNPRAVVRLRRRILKDLGVYDSYAGAQVVAPKYPHGRVLSHVHTCLWLPGTHSREDFAPLLEKHVETVPGATERQHTPSKAITVWNHSTAIDTRGNDVQLSDDGATYHRVTPQGVDSVRGATTALPYELAENLPLMDTETDASDLYDDRALAWCATMSAGIDGDHTSAKGVRRWVTLGRFDEYADTMEATHWRQAERDLSQWTHRLRYEGVAGLP